MDTAANTFYLLLIASPFLVVWVWARRALKQGPVPVWKISSGIGISITASFAIFSALSGESWLFWLGAVGGLTSGVGFLLWSMDAPEVFRHMQIKPIEIMPASREIIFGRLKIPYNRLISALSYFVLVVAGYLALQFVFDQEAFARNWQSQLWIVPIALVFAVIQLFGKWRHRR